MNKERNSNGAAAAGGEDCIKVAVRVRPLIESEIVRGCRVIVQKTPLSSQISVNNKERFTFNYAFDMDETQEMVYANAVRPLVQNLFRGLNVTILAYGQTGSGKTHTMGTNFDGDASDDSGLIPRAIEQIYEQIEQHADTHDFNVTCSFIELYQEQLYDLLSTAEREQSVVDLREDGRGVFIANLSEVQVESAGDAIDCLMKGSSGRAVGATAMNSASSRSHAIYTVNVRMSPKTCPDTSSTVCEATTAKFHLVDLAGSERSAKTKATGQRFKEGVKINQGLLALGNVISALGSAQRSGGHVGYRDSKLTRLLQDSLGGNSVTLMIACVSPADYNSDETLSTLRYADRAKQIRNKPVVNQDPKTAEILRLRALVDKLRLQLVSKVSGVDEPGPEHDPADLSVASPRAAKMRRMSNMAAGSEELAQLRAENGALKLDLAQQRTKLSRTLRNLSDVNMKFVALEDRAEQLTERLRYVSEQLAKIVNGTAGGPSAPSADGGPEALIDRTEQLRKLLESVQQTADKLVDAAWWSSGEQESTNVDEEPEWSEAQEQQMIFNDKLIDIQQQIHLKSAVNARCLANLQRLQSLDEPMVDYAERLAALEAELATERQAHEELKTKGGKSEKAAKISEDRRQKIQKMEKEAKELQTLRDKQKQMKQQQDMYKKQLEQQTKEMESLKRVRAKLTRDMTQLKVKNQQELNKRKHENIQIAAKALKEKTALTAKFVKSEKEKMAMKIKMDNINQVNNRLKKAMENHTNAQRKRRANPGGNASQKASDIQALIDTELEIIYSVVDAKHSLQQLMDDRAEMAGRMMEMRRSATALSAEETAVLAQLKEDVEMRNVQIADMQEKIRSSNVDEKIKSIVDGLNSLPDSRTAVRYLFASLTDLRMEYDTKATSVHDIRSAYDDLVEQKRAQAEAAEEDLRKMRDECKRMRDEHLAIEHSYEEKVSLLLFHHNKRTEGGGGNANAEGGGADSNSVHQRINDELLDSLRAKVESYEAQLREQQALMASMRNLRRVKTKRTPEDEIAFRSISVSSEDAFEDDSDDDPDWHKTPARERKRQPLRARDSNTSDNMSNAMANLTVTVNESTQRHKCNCKGTCKTKVCGCRKAGLACSQHCGCNHERCENIADSSGLAADGTILIATGKESDETTVGNEENQAIGVLLSPNRPTMSVMDTTTPYPYENKKRKPLLDI